MSSPEQQCAPGQLWIPGMHLDADYPTPTDEEMRALWEEYSGRTAYSTEDVFGVYSQPEHGEVRAIASVDLCEVVRDTVVSLDLATGYEPRRRSVYASQDRWFNKDLVGNDVSNSVVVSMVRAVMQANHIAPIESIETVRSTLQSWRKAGIFCVANTSTLPGCEPSTIRHTMGDSLPGCFDGLVLPRNHDGSGLHKAVALRLASRSAGLPIDEVPVIHIDDAPHHIHGFVDGYVSHARARFFTPIHSDNHEAPADTHCASTSDAFAAADDFFRQQGVLA